MFIQSLFTVVRSSGAWLSQGQKLGLCLLPIGFLQVQVTIFNIYRTTMTFASQHGQNISATFNYNIIFAGGPREGFTPFSSPLYGFIAVA